jgi:type II secretory ATPase GspE/PulE/Tfp pilus assembly ATPase PilB-like protein
MTSDMGKTGAGELLLASGKLTEKQLELARRRESRLRIPLHKAIVDLNFASEEDAYRAMAEVSHLDFVDLSKLEFSKATLQLVPVKLVLHYRIIPLSLENGVLTLAMSEVPGMTELGNLRLLLGKKLKLSIATPSGIHAIIKQNYGLGADTIQQLRDGQGFKSGTQEVVFDIKSAEDSKNVDVSVSRFVDQILLEALRLDATDIHIEPYTSNIRLRYRIDGVLQDVPIPEGLRQIHDSLVSRLKVMAGLNIAERRIPHDGRIAMKTGQEEYALRVSIIPTKHGEAVCLRILGRQSLFLDLAQLGMEPEQQATLESLTRLPQGMVLITGPTGSGKTTTLYAALANANDSGRKIITIENPVEYQLDGISQIQTHEEIGMTFSNALRSILRHDPDVVLIGEIRDAETAEIAIRAAQTGHLVFSTLHTNDSVSTITRLIEMGIEPFLVGSSLVCSIAQRLARRVCRNCRTEDTAIPDPLRKEMATALGILPSEVKAWRGKGCVECNQHGFRGRVAIYEFFILTDQIADILTQNVTTGQLRAAAAQQGWKPLRTQAFLKVQSGLVSVEETQRLTLRVCDYPVLHKPKSL